MGLNQKTNPCISASSGLRCFNSPSRFLLLLASILHLAASIFSYPFHTASSFIYLPSRVVSIPGNSERAKVGLWVSDFPRVLGISWTGSWLNGSGEQLKLVVDSGAVHISPILVAWLNSGKTLDPKLQFAFLVSSSILVLLLTIAIKHWLFHDLSLEYLISIVNSWEPKGTLNLGNKRMLSFNVLSKVKFFEISFTQNCSQLVFCK